MSDHTYIDTHGYVQVPCESERSKMQNVHRIILMVDNRCNELLLTDQKKESCRIRGTTYITSILSQDLYYRKGRD